MPYALRILLPLALATAGCAELSALGLGVQHPAGPSRAIPPTVQVSLPQLRRAPNLLALAAYYCPQILDNPIARMGCSVTLGPPPPPEQLAFEFGLTITAKNPNDIPIPALDILLALTLFQGQEAEGLGALCVSLCGQADPSCTGAPRPGACTSSQQDIRRIEDFAARIPGLLAGLVSGQTSLEQELRKSTIAARGDLRLDLAFRLGVEQMLRIVQKVARRFTEGLLKGQELALDIPVAAQGTVFVELPVVGRLGVGFGPLQTSWRIDRMMQQLQQAVR
ncbi:MAG: hypothetical protein RMK29_21560 [Myxococcales bacterium]|nr:hypothetical protein [Myxococcota bacterium]MDW8284300.1 hypothetical protein [Myxococcales bacterium]